jgi:hypothetical protein
MWMMIHGNTLQQTRYGDEQKIVPLFDTFMTTADAALTYIGIYH